MRFEKLRNINFFHFHERFFHFLLISIQGHVMKYVRASMGTISCLKVPSNVQAAKALFETCCQAYKMLLDANKPKLHWMRLEYSIRCGYPDFEMLHHVIGMQDMSTQCNQNIYGIFVPVEHYLLSLDKIIELCLQQGLNNGHNAELLEKSSTKVKLISMLIRQLGVTGSCLVHSLLFVLEFRPT
jgi:hypothetical protein